MIIHISGASGSGKSTLGNRLAKHYKNKIIVKDLDDLLFEFVITKEKSNNNVKIILKNWSSNYQKYIDSFIKKNKNKNIIFVGLNVGIGSVGFRGKSEKLPDTFYNLHADYKFYIDLPVEQILRQKFYRQALKICERKEKYYEKWLNNPNKTQKDLFYSININLWKKETEKWNKLYKRKKYIFLSPDKIYNKILKLY